MSDQNILQQTRRQAPRRSRNDLLGEDFLFPLDDDGSGDFATVTGAQNLQQAIIDIIEDLEGSVIYHEDMGAGTEKGVHRSVSWGTARALANKVQEQIMKFEARVAWIEVKGTPVPAERADEDDAIDLDITFEDITYHHKDNFTYNFVVREKNR